MGLRRRTIWLTSIAASLILIGLVVAQVDWGAARVLVLTTNYGWIGAGIALLLLEGLISAARFQLLARTPVSYGACMRAAAWYVLMLIGLPARLGEVAGIGIIVHHMGERAGAAAASLLFQRLFDLIVLLLLMTGVCALAFSKVAPLPVFLLIGAILAMLLALLSYLEALLAIVARRLILRRHEKWPRRFLRVVLQARMVSRHHMDRKRRFNLGAFTLLKWVANLSGIACVVIAVVSALSPSTALGVGIVYNLSAVIPIQTVGGFGISEVALLGSFSWLGYSIEVGAPIAIAIRLALISAPILFWILILAGDAIFALLPLNRDFP